MNSITRNLMFAIVLAASSLAHAQQFPAKPVRVVVAIGPGSSMDIVARIVSQKLNEGWNQPIVIDNRGGAGGNLAADLVAKAAPDGHTLLFCSSSLAISSSMYRKLPYDALRDLVPVVQISSRPIVLVVNPTLPVNSVKDVIALAKAKPGQLNFGSGGGIGSSDHMAGELFKYLAGVNIVHVPYKSGPAVLTDLINGQLSVYFGGVPVNLPMIRAGKVKPLGTSGTKRSPALPDVPTIAEAGVPGYEVNVWYGLMAPHGTPKHIVGKIAADVAGVLKTAEIQERFALQGVEAAGSAPDQFRTYFQTDVRKWGQVIKAAGVSVD
jgi:tripartite-type tricarboxylate transporter receptor subunit TctC